jgi:hypothetical protein
MLMTALARNGVPTLAVYYQKDMIKDEKQKQQFQEQIDQLAVGGTLSLPGRKGENFEVEPIKLDSSGINTFIEFAQYCDEMMSSALSFTNSLFSSGSSYSQSDIQKQTSEEAIDIYVDVHKRAIIEDIVKPLAKYNFPEIYKNRDWGTFTGKSISLEDKGKLAKVFEMFANNGVIDTKSLEDINYFRESLDLPLFTSADDLPDPEDLVPNSMRDTQGTYSNQEFNTSSDTGSENG